MNSVEQTADRGSVSLGVLTEQPVQFVTPREFIAGDIQLPAADARVRLRPCQAGLALLQRTPRLNSLRDIPHFGEHARDLAVLDQRSRIDSQRARPSVIQPVEPDNHLRWSGQIPAEPCPEQFEHGLHILPIDDAVHLERADLAGRDSQDVAERLVRDLDLPVQPHQQQPARCGFEDQSRPRFARLERASLDEFCGDIAEVGHMTDDAAIERDVR